MTKLKTISVSKATPIQLDRLVAKCEGKMEYTKLEPNEKGQLPYVFDLVYDIKMMWEIEHILAGKPHCSGLDAQGLREAAAELGYEIDTPVYPAYSTSWEFGGPLIEREKISLDYMDEFGAWSASIVREYGQDRESYSDDQDREGYTVEQESFVGYGPTPLIAAMRCFVCSRLGETVEIPEELK